MRVRSLSRLAAGRWIAAAAMLATGCDEIDLRYDPDGGGIIIGPGSGSAIDGGAPAQPGDPIPPPLPPIGPGSAATACQRELGQRGVTYSVAAQPMASPPGRPDVVCVVDDPVLIAPRVRGVTYHPAGVTAATKSMFMSCALALTVDRMSQVLADRGVTDAAYLGIYGCRVVAGTSTLSEHGRGRAIDLAAFKLRNGTTHTVLTEWEKGQPTPLTPAGSFLRQVVTSLFEGRIFTIILTPDYNADHANHFHLDITPDASLFK